MQAARHGYEKVVKHLLNNKAKINATTPIGVSALTLAIHGGHTKVRCNISCEVISKYRWLSLDFGLGLGVPSIGYNTLCCTLCF